MDMEEIKICQVVSCRRTYPEMRFLGDRSRPQPIRPRPEDAQSPPADQMALMRERIVDRGIGGEETLN